MDDNISFSTLDNTIRSVTKRDEITKITPYKKNPKLNVIIRRKQTHMELAKYLHASLFSPTSTTLINAIKQGFLKTFPGLTTSLISTQLPKSTSTTLGHMKHEKQGLQSTSKPTATHQ